MARDIQLQARSFFRSVKLPGLGEFILMRQPIHYEGWDWQAYHVASTPGQDNREVYREIGVSPEDLALFRGMGVV